MGISIGGYFRIAVAAVVSYYSGNWYILASQVAQEEGRRKRDSNNRRARREFNAAQKDRLEMVDVVPDQARTLCLGRVRYVEGIRRRFSSGPNKEVATLIVSFAGHQIDGYEQWYLDDMPVTLDAQGWVQEAPYGAVSQVPRTDSGSADASGNATITLTGTPTGGQVSAVWRTFSGDNDNSGSAVVVLSGATAAVSGAMPNSGVELYYTESVASKTVRIRPYLGTSSQNIGADIAAEYPGEITSADRFAGIAAAVVDFVFNPDVFPQSFPRVAPLFRGALCLDPRTGTTAFTENPALHARRYATWEHGWALRSQDLNDDDIRRAADICDVSTAFTLSATGGGTSSVTLPRYRSGLTISSDLDHGSAMAGILQTMAGRDGWAGGVWRLRAGHMRAPVAHIDETWLVSPVQADGTLEDGPVVSVVHALPREQRYNRVRGKCVDPAQRYQMLPYPAVKDAVLIASKGERPVEIDFPGCNHIAHAQHLASIAIREAQAGLRAQLSCGAQALPLELFDVLTWTHPRSGITAKTVEVVGWGWAPGEPFKVQLAEITAEMFTVEAVLTGRDPAPDSTLRRPWEVEQLGALTVTSGTPALSDAGSIITRTRVQWPAVTNANVRQGGDVEVQYHDTAFALPTLGKDWSTWPEAGTAIETVIPGLQAGHVYLVRGRAVQRQPLVRGPWTGVVTHRVATGAQDDLQDQLAAALAAAATAQATADGKIDTFWQTTAPSAADEGDLWFDTDDGLKQYRYTGGVWTLAVDVRVGQAIAAAAGAQATADGKVTTFVQTIAPTAVALGDLWLDSDDGNALYRWNGATWVALPVGTGGIAANAATEFVEFYDAGGIVVSNLA